MTTPKVISRQLLASGSIVELESLTVDFGSEGGALYELDKITLKEPASVLVVPFDEACSTYLIREFGAGVESSVLKFPTGRIGTHEDARAAAGRELVEETGWQAGSLTNLGQLNDEPGHSNATTTLFLAEHLRTASALGDEPQQPEVLGFPACKLIDLIRSGRLMDARSIAAVMCLLVHLGSPILKEVIRNHH